MSEQKLIVRKAIMVGALMLAVVSLPFSIKICHGAIVILIANWLMEGNWRAKFSVIGNSLLLQLGIGLFMLQSVGLLFTDDLGRGWFSLEKKMFFLLLPIAFATTSVKLTRSELRLIFGTFIAACWVGSMVCIASAWHETNLMMAGQAAVNPYLSSSSYWQMHGAESPKWLMFSYVGLTSGIGIHPTYFSLFLGVCIMCLLYIWPSLNSRVMKAGALTLLLYFSVFVVFLSARIIIVGLGIIFIFVLIRCAIRKEKSLSFVAIGMASFLTALLFLNPVSRYRSLEEIGPSTFVVAPGNHYTNAAQIRMSLWWLALRSLKDTHPLFGSGTGDVEKVMTAASDEFQITNVIQSFDPHNEFLYTLIANGFPGLLLLILSLGLPAWYAWLGRDYLVLGFLVLFWLVCLTESALELQKGIVLYALVTGLLFFQRHSYQNVPVKLNSILRVSQ
jgi:O-antigen ligase